MTTMKERTTIQGGGADGRQWGGRARQRRGRMRRGEAVEGA
jgi:hypothetical protein